MEGSKLIRAPSLKRGKNDERLCDRIKLERVLGLTVGSNAALDCSPSTGVLAYPAGCTVVLFNPKKSRQTHILNTSKKSITSVCFSHDGKILATGESGHLPSVRVWDLEDSTTATAMSGNNGFHNNQTKGAGNMIAEFTGHKYAVNCVAFSPNGKYLVSVGSQHDMIVNVWDWKAGIKVASNKVSARVKAVSFADNGSYFVTVGNRHVKFWYLECARPAKFKEPVPLMGRSAILGEQRNNDFVDVCCGRGAAGDSTYAITKSGLLCEFNHRRLLEKWVELRTPSANCMSVGERFIFIGCADGIVRCFDPTTMQFITTLPRTHSLGVDVSQGLNISHMLHSSPNSKYPDTIAVSYDEFNGKLSCVYNDHSLYIWDVRDIKRVGKSHSFLYHSACIWGVETPHTFLQQQSDSSAPALPQDCFVTCSSDDTIRIWNLDENHNVDENSRFRRNIYSKELLKVLYVDPDLGHLKDMELFSSSNLDKTTTYDGRNGVRAIRISPDGEHLASGDRSGNIRVHSLRTFKQLYHLEAHDAEVLCLEYTNVNNVNAIPNIPGFPVPSGNRKLLASASRDRLIHVFSVDEEYSFIQTLDDHSSSITSVRFLGAGSGLQMVSCGADKSIIFRQLSMSPGGTETFTRGYNCSGKTTLYDMEVDSNHKHVLTACQDRNIRVYSTQNGKHTKTFKGSASEEGTLIKVSLDSSGIYVATSCTDKTLSVYDYYSGECMATMLGHSELVTGLRFSNDSRHLISASGDGCIFIWKVPHDMVVTMQARLAQQALRMGRKPPKQIPVENDLFTSYSHTEIYESSTNAQTIAESVDYRFSIGQLPSWAKKQIGDTPLLPPTEITSSRAVPEPPRGRWAKRAEPLTVGAQFPADNIMQFPLDQRLDSDGSKDSSLDSGTEVKPYKNIKETAILNRMDHVTLARGTGGKHTDDSSLGSLRFEDLESTEHDGDVEDYSDGERTSSDHHTMYYPAANSDTPTDFTINAMDVEELGKSQRRLKAKKLSNLTLKVPEGTGTSVSGSQDSEEDEDEVSTPSGDNAERSLASTLGGSMESLTGAATKGFLQMALDGPVVKMDSGNSYSAKHLSNSPAIDHLDKNLRNASVIQATRLGKSNDSRREELQRRIEETKRKLQSVGYRSNLKSSQSISDLSKSGTNLSATMRPASKPLSSDSWSASGDGLRKACSLSDLSSPLQGKKTVTISGKTNKPAPVPRKLQLQKSPIKSGMGQRSVSTGVLNHSDSESDVAQSNPGTKRLGGLMRPTISSQNKTNVNSGPGIVSKSGSNINGKPGKSSKSSSFNRRRMQNSYSSVNLTTVGNEDSSSEEIGTSNIGSNNKPIVPPRPRSILLDHSRRVGRSGSERDLTPRAREITNRLTGGSNITDKRMLYDEKCGNISSSSSEMKVTGNIKLPPSPLEIPCKDTDSIDVTNTELSMNLCKQLAEQLTKTAENVVQLYKRLSINDPSGSNIDLMGQSSGSMLKGLEMAMMETQRKLQLATTIQTNSYDNIKDVSGHFKDSLCTNFDDNTNINGNDPKSVSLSNNFNQNNDIDRLQSLMSEGTNSNNMVQFMQQYSDMLLNVMQQQIAGNQKKS